jgi:predicted dehydrogenase
MYKKHPYLLMITTLALAACTPKPSQNEPPIRLVTLDPGHFHAALVQKTSYPEVSNDVYVYAPKGNDLEEHLKKIALYNARTENPTQWNEHVYDGPDYEERMLAERKGNVAVLAGNNGKKIAYIEHAVAAGMNVLADKPMAISAADFKRLLTCFDMACANGTLLYDIMTERFEITTMLQRAFSMLPDVYGEQLKGSPADPAVTKESVHHFFKTVSGKPLIRPAWFFDDTQQGNGLVDVTTHLVDLVQWECFPEQIIDYTTDVEIIDAHKWTTALTAAEFAQVTGLTKWPVYLEKPERNDTLFVYSNGEITYRLKGVCARVSVVWNYTYPEGGGDTHYSVMKGSRAHLVIEQGAEQGYKPVLYIRAAPGVDAEAYRATLEAAFPQVEKQYPGIALKQLHKGVWEVEVPAAYHNGHEAHFAQVTERFLEYVQTGTLPAWEVPNMIAKYYVTTQAQDITRLRQR